MSKKPQKNITSAWFIMLQELLHWSLISGLAIFTVSVHAQQLADASDSPDSSPWVLLASIAIATALVLWLMKTDVGARIFGALFALAVFSGVFTVTFAMLGFSLALISTSATIILYYTNPRVLVFDLILSLGLAGVAVAVGVGFRPIAMTAVLAALSVYDIIAVYLTRHMVLMGRALLRRKVFFAMILPERPAGLLAKMGQVAPGKEFLFLGTGDFVLPALLTVSVAAYYGTAASLFVAVGAAVGLAATHIIFISKSKMRPMAALPPIAAGSVIGYVLSLLMM